MSDTPFDNDESRLQERRAMFREGLTLPDDVFEVLFTEHDHGLYAMVVQELRATEKISADDMLAEAVETLTRQDITLLGQTAKNALAKIAAHPAPLSAAEMARHFRRDGYIGEDFRTILSDPMNADHDDPARVHHSSFVLLRTVREYTRLDIWESEFLKGLGAGADMTHLFGYVRHDQNTRLGLYCHFQMFADNLTLIAAALREAGHANLAAMTSAFAVNARACMDKIEQDVKREIAVAAQITARFFGQAGPNGP